MKPKREYLDYLQDILDASQKAGEFITDLDLERFEKDEKTVFAVIRTLEIIGEAARHIPKSIQESYSQIPWEDIVGMRNIVIHEYFGIDTEVIWRTVKEDLPRLKEAIAEILLKLKKE